QSRKMEALGTLAGGIAHDLNNILTPIIGNAQLCLLDMDPGHTCYSKLQDIVKSAEKAADLIRQILAFSRKQMLVPSTLDLNKMIADFTKMLRRLIREDIELNLDLSEDLWPVDADSSQMGQILINLVVNARDAIPESGKIVIHTRNETIGDGPGVDDESTLAAILQPPSAGSYVVMAITDDGLGMDEETLARIYDPFFTTKEAGKGTGLGLSTVYGIVNQHEGHIQVQSHPERGTTFSIYFKRTEKKLEIADEVKSVQVNRGKETILIAEDNKDVRMLTVSALEYYGYRVITASSGTEAVRIFNEFAGGIDLLLTDVVMPGFRGEAVAQNLRVKQPGLPIIFMSGHPFDVAPRELEKTEHTSFIQKPFKPQTIARKVREMLDRNKPK
ncbi:MAG: response regulator, partial [Desulfobacterales bacterium]|nr:response regulator [Desulfobacterales bacterium]